MAGHKRESLSSEENSMSYNALVVPDHLDVLRPDDLEKNIKKALYQGVSYDAIANHPGVRQAATHFLNEFRKRQGMYEPSTLRRLNSAWGKFVLYCKQTNNYSLPAKPSVVEAYLIARASNCHRNTLNIDIWAISLIHRQAGCPDPTNDQYVMNTQRMLIREKVRKEEPIRQAVAFNSEALNALTVKWRDSPRLIDIRNLALLTVAYESLLRESELAAIRFCHLRKRADGSAVLTIPNTKTNKSGEPEKAVLTAATMSIIQDYVSRGSIDSTDGGYLFRQVFRSGKVKPVARDPVTGQLLHVMLTMPAIESIFVKAWLALNPDVDPDSEPNFRQKYRVYSGHSARVGAAQDLLSAGFDSLQVQQAGRWKSNTMVAQYGADIDADKSAMARFRQGQQIE